MLMIFIADMLEAAELGEFPSPDLPVACYFKCMLEKAGVVKEATFL